MQKKIIIDYEEFNYDDITDAELKELIDSTIKFADNAYAPYSKFHVSAGLRLDSGKIVKGANMENASYPVSICAERNLLSHTVSNYPNQLITMIVVYVDKDLKVPVPPCGLCRQTLVEVEIRQKYPIQLIMYAKNGTVIRLNSCQTLLPWAFDGSFLD
ncbi:MAG: cytidine deaminase [Crocinitomix sp.]|nr:cytidine deaminase [Crocinitomix sp.]